MNVAGDNSVDGFPYSGVTLGPPVTTDGCYPEVATTSGSSSFQPTFTTDAKPIPPDPLLLHTSNDSAKPKSDKITVVIVPILLTILILIAIDVCIIF